MLALPAPGQDRWLCDMPSTERKGQLGIGLASRLRLQIGIGVTSSLCTYRHLSLPAHEIPAVVQLAFQSSVIL